MCLVAKREISAEKDQAICFSFSSWAHTTINTETLPVPFLQAPRYQHHTALLLWPAHEEHTAKNSQNQLEYIFNPWTTSQGLRCGSPVVRNDRNVDV